MPTNPYLSMFFQLVYILYALIFMAVSPALLFPIFLSRHSKESKPSIFQLDTRQFAQIGLGINDLWFS